MKRSIDRILLCGIVFAFFAARGESDAEFVEHLLGRMTLNEKIGQLCQYNTFDATAKASSDGAEQAEISGAFLNRIREGGCGSLISAPGIQKYNLFQYVAVKESRLGIPLLVGHDLVHSADVVFPIPLALSCSWDTKLWRLTADAIARNGILHGCNWTFAPMLDIARDARWGRIMESPGQDPYLASLFAREQVIGFQGENLSDGTHLAACAKHFIGYGAGESGLDYNGVEMSEMTLRNYYLPPFRSAVEAGVVTVMPAFHAFNGIPCSINRYLLTDVLRKDLGFEGYCISDYGALENIRAHGMARKDSEISAMAINSGIDQEMTGFLFVHGIEGALKDGGLSMGKVDESVRRVLLVKKRMGLFEHPFLDEAKLRKNVDVQRDLELSLQAAIESIVLLKNNGILPLGKNCKVALIGSMADSRDEMLSTWAAFANRYRCATLREGLKSVGCQAEFSQCYSITGPVDKAALCLAVKSADVVIAAFGEGKDESGEARSKADIALPANQVEVARLVKGFGKPLISVLFNGRPLAIPELTELSDALIEGWRLGSCAGEALSRVIVGEEEPLGRLTTDFPERSSVCPRYYNRGISGRPYIENGTAEQNKYRSRYLDTDNKSLFPFGFGLTYTQFKYENVRISCRGDDLICVVDVENVGRRKGSDVVQVYVCRENSCVTRPRRELKGFERVALQPGEKRAVEIVIPGDRLLYWSNGSAPIRPTGALRVYVGGDSSAELVSEISY